MNKPFIYDEKTSSLYSPDGKFLKEIFCPKAVNWNQLIADDPSDRSRGCSRCSERVINLDAIEPIKAELMIEDDHNLCVYASKNSKNVIFLKDINNPENPQKPAQDMFDLSEYRYDLPIIRTVRNIADIKRAIQMGYWADIRLIQYRDKEIKQKFAVFQHSETGEIKVTGDYRSIIGSNSDLTKEIWQEVIPFTYYYANYQEEPVAAYLIPRDLKDKSEVFVPDPIEDVIGSTWNQGDCYRATNLTGKLINKKIVIDTKSVQRSDFIG
ncbi:MAG: hypothetical protein RL212_1485 [Pseudomonadota bacterium]|jgi:hypothetical protein